MTEEPDLSFDIDALFDHLEGNLDQEADEELDWVFMLRSADLRRLSEIGKTLEDEFDVRLQEDVIVVDEEGNESAGEPELHVVRRGALTRQDVKAIAERMKTIAREINVVYEGVSCYDPVDEEELFGWLEPDDAAWRLRHFTDTGLKENEELPWVFLVITRSIDQSKSIAAKLKANGFDDLNIYDEADEEGDFGLCVFVSGRNNETELMETAEKISGLAKGNGGRLEGIQFFTREELHEIYADEEQE